MAGLWQRFSNWLRTSSSNLCTPPAAAPAAAAAAPAPAGNTHTMTGCSKSTPACPHRAPRQLIGPNLPRGWATGNHARTDNSTTRAGPVAVPRLRLLLLTHLPLLPPPLLPVPVSSDVASVAAIELFSPTEFCAAVRGSCRGRVSPCHFRRVRAPRHH